MTLRHLKIFLAVYETGSTTAASEVLRIAQPSVSVALKELEEHYGVVVFERFSRRLLVTEAGKELYQYAQHLVRLFDETEEAMERLGEAGTLRIGSSITIANYFLTDYIRSFREAFPKVSVRVIIENTDTIEQLLMENEIDLGLVEGRTRSRFILSVPYRKDSLVMICAPSHSFASVKRVTTDALLKENLLLRERGSAVRELFDARMREKGITVEPIWQSVSTQALIRAVKEGFGISVLPYYLVKDEIDRGEVTAFSVEDLDLSRQFAIAYHRNKFHTVAMEHFIEICTQP